MKLGSLKMGQTFAGGVSWLSVGTGLEAPEFGALSSTREETMGGSAPKVVEGTAAETEIKVKSPNKMLTEETQKVVKNVNVRSVLTRF